jgi:hypothetical protein
MKLSDAARYFDTLAFYDGYSSALLGKCQLDLFNDGTRDSANAARRILSLQPELTPPARRVISFDGAQWLVGNPSSDYFYGAPLRVKYPIHRAEGLATVKTVAQALANATGITAYMAKVWVKGSKELEESSDVIGVLELVAAASEVLAVRTLIQLSGAWYIVRSVYQSSAGFAKAICDQLVDPVFETASQGGRTYDPVTDSYTSTATTLSVIRIRWQSHFEYLSENSEDFKPGDEQAFLLLSAATPEAGDTLTLSDGVFQVLRVVNEGSFASLHLRKIP